MIVPILWLLLINDLDCSLTQIGYVATGGPVFPSCPRLFKLNQPFLKMS